VPFRGKNDRLLLLQDQGADCSAVVWCMSWCPLWVASSVSEGTIAELAAPGPSAISFETLLTIRETTYTLAGSSEVLVTTYGTAWCLILEDLHNVHTGSGAHPASCLVDAVSKAGGIWSSNSIPSICLHGIHKANFNFSQP
jgi:hypothetical protein